MAQQPPPPRYRVTIWETQPDGKEIRKDYQANQMIFAGGYEDKIAVSCDGTPASILFFLELIKEKEVSGQIRAQLQMAAMAKAASTVIPVSEIPKMPRIVSPNGS